MIRKLQLSFVFFLSVLSLSCSLNLSAPLLEVHFINVGHADAIFIKFPDQTNLLVDAGRVEHSGQIINYLLTQHVTRLNRALVTHPKENHFGGFAAISERFLIEHFYINGDEKHQDKGYSDLIRQLQERGTPISVFKRGDSIPAPDHLSISILNPATLSSSASGNSAAILMTYGTTSVLLTADIPEKQQDEIIALYPNLKSVNCVQVPRHGKNVSDLFAASFVQKVFVVSTGTYNGKKPDISPLAKLSGIILRTDQVGHIVVTSDGKKVLVNGMSW